VPSPVDAVKTEKAANADSASAMTVLSLQSPRPSTRPANEYGCTLKQKQLRRYRNRTDSSHGCGKARQDP
jgi:hypothetical protein